MDGQIINKADFDKLVWNGDHNMGGKITYVAVQSDKADAPNVEGAAEKTLTVTESAAVTHPAAPATNPAQNQQQGGNGTPEVQDSKAPAGGEGQKGDQKAGEGNNKADDPQKGGDHGTDGGEHKADTPQNSTTGGDANKGNTNPGSQGAAAGGSTGGTGAQGGSKTQDGGSDSKAGGTTQDAGSQSQGQTPPSKPAGSDPQAGSPSGKPVAPGGQSSDAPSQPAGTPEVQTGGAVNQPGQPPVKAAPSYEPNKSVSVAHDDTNAKIGKEVFEGTNPANKPEAVKATGFAAGTLKVNGVAINDGDKIAAENFDKVTWDASKGEGGTFKFTPVQANGDALQGATEQTITINEAPAAPVVNAEPKLGVYASEKSVVDVGRDADPVKLDSKLFAGTDPEKTPDAVKITVVHGPDNQPTNDGVLTYTVGGQKHSLTSGSFLDKANFDKVEWDAEADSHNAGTYKVHFKPVTADHKDIESATEHNFDVKEASGVPTYESSKMTFNVDTHDGKQFVPESLFKGENADTAPLYVWIKGSTEKDGGSDGHVFMRLADGSNGGLGKDLTTNGAESGTGEVISWSDLSKVQWDAAHNNGGTIKFRPLDGDKQQIGEWQTITVTESPAAPQGSEGQGLASAILNPQGAGTQLKSLAAYTPAEPSSNLLDDLHNQISPLI